MISVCMLCELSNLDCAGCPCWCFTFRPYVHISVGPWRQAYITLWGSSPEGGPSRKKMKKKERDSDASDTSPNDSLKLNQQVHSKGFKRLKCLGNCVLCTQQDGSFKNQPPRYWRYVRAQEPAKDVWADRSLQEPTLRSTSQPSLPGRLS